LFCVTARACAGLLRRGVVSPRLVFSAARSCCAVASRLVASGQEFEDASKKVDQTKHSLCSLEATSIVGGARGDHNPVESRDLW
jgi:hypothetical protein